MRRLLVVNGPNLGTLGVREPEIYGSVTLPQVHELCRSWGAEVQLEVDTYQSNHEGELIDRLLTADFDGVVINPGALTHYSYALHDALLAAGKPAVEVHISDVWTRERWRRRSVVAPACVYTIYGRGVMGYHWAIRHLAFRSRMPFRTLSYGPLDDLVFDLRNTDATRLAVLVHGGFWRHQWTRDLMDGMAVDLAGRGWATANLEYRRVGRGGGWPLSVDDVERGIRAAIDAVSADQVALIGHSAGAHLALLASERLPDVGVVSLAGITDLTEELGDGAVAGFLRGADPRAASPLHRRSFENPTLLVHGTLDDRVPPHQSARFAAGPRRRLLEVPGGDHFFFLYPERGLWQEVVSEIESFVSTLR